MDITLSRTDYRPDGIFGILTATKTHAFICISLEHSYNNLPKLAPGVYRCVRGEHKLHDGKPLDAFMVLNVPDFEGKSVFGILFHILNFNSESEGCIGLGKQRGFKTDGSWMLMKSKDAFTEFMKLQENVDEFILTVNA